MAVVVPAGSKNWALAQEISNLQSLITSNSGKPHAIAFKQRLPELYRNLVNALMDSGELTPASILSNMTYKQQETGTLY